MPVERPVGVDGPASATTSDAEPPGSDATGRNGFRRFLADVAMELFAPGSRSEGESCGGEETKRAPKRGISWIAKSAE